MAAAGPHTFSVQQFSLQLGTMGGGMGRDGVQALHAWGQVSCVRSSASQVSVGDRLTVRSVISKEASTTPYLLQVIFCV